jgi:hypothetical protein
MTDLHVEDSAGYVLGRILGAIGILVNTDKSVVDGIKRNNVRVIEQRRSPWLRV